MKYDGPTVAEKYRGDVLLVSPHLDDAVLSCEAWVSRSEPIDVLTVFCGRPSPQVRTSWDRSAGFEDSDHAVSSRLLEDTAAFADTHHRRHHLQLLDNQYLRGPRPEEDVTILLRWIEDWLGRARSPLVLIPVGAGLRPIRALARYPTLARLSCVVERRLRSILGSILHTGINGHPPHTDHEWISQTISDYLSETGIRWGFYTEFPYVFGGDGRRSLAALPRGDWAANVRRLRMPVERTIKARRIAAYRSQVALIADSGKPLEEWIPPAEIYWFVGDGDGAPAVGERSN